MSSEPCIELHPGTPWASCNELNRLLRQQGLCLAVAEAAILDQICQAIALPPEEEQRLAELYLSNQGVDSEQERQAWLQRKGWQENDLIYFASKRHRLELFKQRVFEQEVEIRFLERKLDLDQVTYSLLRVEDQLLAEELYHRLADDGADWAELAQAHSQGPERGSGGRIGPVPLTQAHPAVSERLRTNPIGEVIGPFWLVNIWVLLRLEAWDPAPLDELMRQQLREELFEQWLEERSLRLLAGDDAGPLPEHLLEP